MLNKINNNKKAWANSTYTSHKPVHEVLRKCTTYSVLL